MVSGDTGSPAFSFLTPLMTSRPIYVSLTHFSVALTNFLAILFDNLHSSLLHSLFSYLNFPRIFFLFSLSCLLLFFPLYSLHYPLSIWFVCPISFPFYSPLPDILSFYPSSLLSPLASCLHHCLSVLPTSWAYRISNTALLSVPGPKGVKVEK